MLRGFALLTGLLAALPAMAGEMSADEARRFVIGKMFNYTCFEGTRGQGRVLPDGSVIGSIQVRGAGQIRYATLPPGTLRVKGEAFAPRCAVCRLSRASIWSGSTTTASAVRSQAWILPIANSTATTGARPWRTARSRWACALRSPPKTTRATGAYGGAYPACRKWLAHSCGVKACSASPTFSQSALQVRAAAFRRRPVLRLSRCRTGPKHLSPLRLARTLLTLSPVPPDACFC